MNSKQLREKRANLAEQSKAILDKASAENRELTSEEQVSFDKIHADIERLGADVERVERQEKIDGELRSSRGTKTVENVKGKDAPDAEERKAQYERAFDAYLRFGKEELEPEQRALLRGNFRREEGSAVNETRAAQTVTTSGGGYLIPEDFSAQLEVSMAQWGGVEAACDVFNTSTGAPLPWPTVNDTSNTGRLLAINTAATETAVAYGVVDFAAYKFSSDMVTVPVELLQDSAFDLNAHLAEILGRRIGTVHNTYQTTGTGSSQPQGIVTGASSGLTAAGASTITADELLDLIHSVDPAYRNPAFGAGFMFNDGSLKKIRQLKDGDGRYIWQPGLVAGQADTLLGFPYVINQSMAAMTTGLKPVLFGALKKFKIRKVKGFTLLRLEERYAEAHQVAYLAFTRMDSKMLDAGTDPCKYITMA
jgi:HK97 family phage major capsid protein